MKTGNRCMGMKRGNTMNISEEDIALVLRALAFAAEKHRSQKRKGRGQSPYINHLIDVAQLLWELGGVRDIATIVAGILHDTLEDTDTTAQELAALFGGSISSVVQEVTDDKSLPQPVRKRLQIEHAAGLSARARLVKIADKISNITDIMNAPPKGWSARRRREYVEWGQDVIARIRGTNESMEQHFDELCAHAFRTIGEDTS